MSQQLQDIKTSLSSTKLFFDVETTTRNKGHPFTLSNKLISYVTLDDSGVPFFFYHSDPDFLSRFRKAIELADILVGFNVKFDLHWCSRYKIVLRPGQRVWDCQLAEFVLSGQRNGMMSLNEALASYGLDQKVDAVAEYWKAGVDTADIPVAILEEYNKYDVQCLVTLMDMQQALMTPEQINLVYLMGEDLKTLQHAEYSGIQFDRDGAIRLIDNYRADIRQIEQRLAVYADVPDGITFNFDSGDQLSALLYGGTLHFDYSVSTEATYQSGEKKGQAYTRNRWYVYEKTYVQRFKPLEGTTVKKCLKPDYKGTIFYQVDAPTLLQLKSKRKEDKGLVTALLQRSAKIKVVEMVESIINKMNEMEWQDNLLHPQFNQNIAITGRLTSSNPNGQNTPPDVDALLISRYDN